jgi:hypothetical protein
MRGLSLLIGTTAVVTAMDASARARAKSRLRIVEDPPLEPIRPGAFGRWIAQREAKAPRLIVLSGGRTRRGGARI